MSRQPFCMIRADASPLVGAGHIVRCMSLADALSIKGWRCLFAVGPDTLSTVSMLKHSPYEVAVLTEAEESVSLDAISDSHSCDLLVVDHYRLGASFEQKCRSWARRILAIDDLANRDHDCDWLLDQTFGRMESAYEGLVPETAELLLGTRFALLRKQFPKYRQQAVAWRADREGRVDTVLISCGATDPAGVVPRAIAAAAAATPHARLEVLVSSATSNLASIESAVGRAGPRVRLHKDVCDVATFMLRADIAIATPGSSSWERCCLGLPSITIAVGSDQLEIAALLHSAGAAVHLGWHENVEGHHVQTALHELAENAARVRSLNAAAFDVCDGLGAQRAAAHITDWYEWQQTR